MSTDIPKSLTIAKMCPIICLLWKPTKATHKRELLRCVAVIAGRWVGGGGVGTKILACGAPRAFPGCHFLGQNYTPRQTGNRPGAVPQTSVVCSHNSPHVPLFVYLCAFVSFLFLYFLPQVLSVASHVYLFGFIFSVFKLWVPHIFPFSLL